MPSVTRFGATKRKRPLAMNTTTHGNGSEADPWILQTPSLSSEFQAWRDETADPPALVVQVGATRLSYQLRGLDDLRAMLQSLGGWVELGNADEGKPVKDGSVEACARGRQSGGRLLWPAQGLSRPVRQLCHARPRAPRARGVGTWPAQQPGAGNLTPEYRRGLQTNRTAPHTGGGISSGMPRWCQ